MFLIPLAIILTIIGILFFIYKKYEKFVFEHSIALQDLDKINYKYRFKEVKFFKLVNSYDNENYYNLISPQDFLIYNLVFINKEVKENINYAFENAHLFDLYSNEISNINTMGLYDTKELKFHKLLFHLEKRLFSKYTKKPTIVFGMKVILYLTNINGRIYNNKSQVFYESEIEELISRLNDKWGDRYTDKDIWNAICRVERGKVTNKIRFFIYNRDNYCCRKCGRKTKNLEIDHIIPISKGGKTKIDNLQTLCSYCNSQKSDIIEPGVFVGKSKYNKFCPYCGAPLQLHKGKYGKFYGCMNYPKCQYTKKV